MIVLDQVYELLNGGLFYGNPTWNKNHTDIDNCFKIYQLTEGSIILTDNDTDYVLEKDKLYFINGNKLNKQFCYDAFRTYWIHFVPKDIFIYQALASAPLVVEIENNFKSFGKIPNFEEYISNMQNKSSLNYSIFCMHIQDIIQRTIIALFEKDILSTTSCYVNTKRIQPAIQYINDNYKDHIDLKKLGDLCNMSPNYFHKIFKQTVSITPANYMMLLRMNTSLKLLKNKSNTIKSIALELGFTDVPHFSKAFKKYYGITPGKYQRKADIKEI